MINKIKPNYFRKILEHISTSKYMFLEYELFAIPENQLEAFWHIIVAGYPVQFAIINYINLYEHARNNSINYKTALKNIYSISTGLNIGIKIKNPEWFELN